MMKFFYSLLFYFSFSLLYSSCKDENENRKGTVEIVFDHEIEGNSLILNKEWYTNEFGNKYNVTTLRYYISNIELIANDGNNYLVDTIFYRDVTKENSRILKLENVPNKAYEGLSFTFGIDSSRNISNALSYLDNMEWPEHMGGGYHYMKFEGTIINASTPYLKFNTHTGRLQFPFSTGPMYNHDFNVSLISRVGSCNINGDTWSMIVKMDLNEWYKIPYTYDITTHTNVMDNLEAQQVLMQNGKDAFKLENVYKKE